MSPAATASLLKSRANPRSQLLHSAASPRREPPSGSPRRGRVRRHPHPVASRGGSGHCAGAKGRFSVRVFHLREAPPWWSVLFFWSVSPPVLVSPPSLSHQGENGLKTYEEFSLGPLGLLTLPFFFFFLLKTRS